MSVLIAHPSPAAFDEHDAAIPAGLHELAFPLACALELCLDGGEADGEARLEQTMADAALRLLGCPAVEFLSSPIPEEHPAHGVADEDSIMRQIDELGLQANLLSLQEALALGHALGGHIANGCDDMERTIKQQGVQTDLHRKFR